MPWGNKPWVSPYHQRPCEKLGQYTSLQPTKDALAMAAPDHKTVTALSVNVNKVALIRNTRHLGIPSVLRAAQLCIEAGAAGITVHPRPDERHIRATDVYEIAELLKQYPHIEFNIEGNPHHNLMAFVEATRPTQCTLVPDAVDQFTSDHGWQFPQDAVQLQPI